MKPCSVLGSGASTSLLQLLCRLLPRCRGPRDHSVSPAPRSVLNLVPQRLAEGQLPRYSPSPRSPPLELTAAPIPHLLESRRSSWKAAEFLYARPALYP